MNIELKKFLSKLVLFLWIAVIFFVSYNYLNLINLFNLNFTQRLFVVLFFFIFTIAQVGSFIRMLTHADDIYKDAKDIGEKESLLPETDVDRNWKKDYLFMIDRNKKRDEELRDGYIKLKTDKNIYELSEMLDMSVLKVLTSSQFSTISLFEQRDVREFIYIKYYSYDYFDNHLEGILKDNTDDFEFENDENNLILFMSINPDSYEISYQGNLKIGIRYFINSNNSKGEKLDLRNSFIVGEPYTREEDSPAKTYNNDTRYYTIQNLIKLRRDGIITIKTL